MTTDLSSGQELRKHLLAQPHRTAPGGDAILDTPAAIQVRHFFIDADGPNKPGDVWSTYHIHTLYQNGFIANTVERTSVKTGNSATSGAWSGHKPWWTVKEWEKTQ